MDSKFDLTVGICTRNRQDKCLSLLESLEKNEKIIGNIAIVVVEDTSDNQHFSQQSIQKIFKSSNQVKIIYKNVKYQNVSKSRNLILKTANSKFLIFIDDDVCLAKNSILETINILKQNEKNAVVIGLLKPKIKNLVSIADSVYYNRERFLLKRKELEMAPFSFVGINLYLIKKHQIKFDEKFNKPAGEDIDFCLQVIKRKLKILFDSNIVNYHFFDTDLSSLLRKKQGYGKYIFQLCKKHPQYIHLSYYVSTNRIWKMLPFLGIFIRSLETLSYSRKIKMPLISRVILFVTEYVVNKATYDYFSASTNKLKFCRS